MNVRLVVQLIGVVLILAVLAIAALAVLQRPIPDVLQNIAIGALTGLLGLPVPNHKEL